MSWPDCENLNLVLDVVNKVESGKFPGLYGGHETFHHFGYSGDKFLV
jgi:hypothetical protein